MKYQLGRVITLVASMLIVGCQGPQGDKGEKGDTGQKGDTGPIGPKGDKGDKGEAVYGELNSPEIVPINGKYIKWTRAYWSGGADGADHLCSPQPKEFEAINGYTIKTNWGYSEQVYGKDIACPISENECDSTGEFCRNFQLLLGCYVRDDVLKLVKAANPQLPEADLVTKLCKQTYRQ